MLYVILCAVGWILVLWFIIRPLLVWACRRTGAYGDKGPSEGIICLVVFLVLASAWVTDRIGMWAFFSSGIAKVVADTHYAWQPRHL